MTGNMSPAKAWLRALELTSPIANDRERVVSTVIEELAARLGDTPALLSDRECMSYRALAERSTRYCRWALDHDVKKGDIVCLLMTNRPEYMAVWIGITMAGGIVSLLNTNLVGTSLSHCVDIVSPRHLIVATEFLGSLATALPSLTTRPRIWTDTVNNSAYPTTEADQYSGETLTGSERRPLAIEDRALLIYTSGTTGLPKAVNVSHARIMQWTHWFAGMTGAQPTDRMYNCLPMYHSVGGVLVPGAALVAGGTVVIREKFSARHFWSEVIRWDCTMFQYIGELCRYLIHTPPCPGETEHRIRIACGNGMAPEVWDEFKNRFRIPRILEFYAATEGGVSLFNVEGERGAIGRIPSYLAHRFSPALVRFDVEKGEPVRNEQGFCIRCAPNEVGEAIGKVRDDPADVGSRFEGYTNEDASERRRLRHVFEPGDVWVRTGDLMRKDEKGFFYFVDRVGDTFRWKGENVATSEVSAAISTFPGVKHAIVYGVAVPSAEGRAGMALLDAEQGIDLAAFRKHLISHLPRYARPMFLRIRKAVEVTGTLKYSKTELVRQAYDPVACTDTIYFEDPESEVFVKLDNPLFERIQSGDIRL